MSGESDIEFKPENVQSVLGNYELCNQIITVATCRGFTNAAAALGVSKSQVSKNIKEAERLLGWSIFARTTRSVSLTPKGLKLFGAAREVLALIDTKTNVILGMPDQTDPIAAWVIEMSHDCSVAGIRRHVAAELRKNSTKQPLGQASLEYVVKFLVSEGYITSNETTKILESLMPARHLGVLERVSWEQVVINKLEAVIATGFWNANTRTAFLDQLVAALVR